ncbi:MAG: DsbA oxidoreductase [uncultured bacterium (gcode 4)]|uniref:DsbA oxidoreductase n=1 Tax=uncultured bacterium (gcode 4) TaxID=1234023 RepID=K2GHZ3_9BACT|nr:MAG: DsbA oxidoreductase [uncultured bacterium (gcode 4)]
MRLVLIIICFMASLSNIFMPIKKAYSVIYFKDGLNKTLYNARALNIEYKPRGILGFIFLSPLSYKLPKKYLIWFYFYCIMPIISNIILRLPMIKKILILLSLSFFLFSCSQQRDIFNEGTSKNFIQKNIDSPSFGNPAAKVQLIEFGDFQCPACIFFEKEIWQKLFKDYVLTNKIWITYKNFPLSAHRNAPEDALAAMCAHEQWKYMDFATRMYAFEDEKKWLVVTKEDRENIAASAWADMIKFKQCVLEWRYVDKIKQDMELGEKMWLQWTPSVYANWQLINFDSVEGFFKILDQLIAQQ